MKKFNKFILLLLSLVFALSFAVFAIPNPDEAPEIIMYVGVDILQDGQ